MRRMKLCLLILSLQLAQIASSEVGPIHSENAALRRRQILQVTGSNLEAELVQGEGASRVSKSRARQGSRLPDQEGNVISHRRKASRKGGRKGGKGKKGTTGLLKQQILNRLVKSDQSPVDKEERRSGQGQGRRVAMRRKGISNIRDPIGSKQDKIFKVQQTDTETLQVKHRTGLTQRRPTVIEYDEQTEIPKDKTTTVNPVLIWRQQAAVTEQGSTRPGVKLTGRRGAAQGRRRNIKRGNGERKSTLNDEKGNHSVDSKIEFPSRIKSSRFQLQGKGSLIEKLDDTGKEKTTNSKEFRAAHGSFVFNSPEKIKDQTEKDKSSGRLAPNLNKSTEILFSRENLDKKSDTKHRFSSERRFGHLRQNLSKKEHGVSKSKENKSTVESFNERRKPIRTNPKNSLSISIAPASIPISDSLKNVNKAETNKIFPRRGSPTPRRNHENKDPLPSSKENSTLVRKINQRLRSQVNPRLRNRERNIQTDSDKHSGVSLDTTKSRRPTSHISYINDDTKLHKMSEIIKKSDKKQLKIGFDEAPNDNTVQTDNTASQVEHEEMKQFKKNETSLLKEKNKLNGISNRRCRPESKIAATLLTETSGFHKEATEQKGRQTSKQMVNPDNGRSSLLSNGKVDQRLKERFDPRRRNIERISNEESKYKHVRPSTKQAETITASTIKDSYRRVGNITSLLENKDIEQGNKKNNPAQILSTKRKLSTPRRRGQIPQGKENLSEYSQKKEQNSKRPQTTAARRVNHRFRQRFDPRSKQTSNDAAAKATSAISVISFGRARNIEAKQISTQKPSTVHAASDRYFEIAFKHAQVTWAQDPFRKDSEVVDGPQFDIDYTKDPNFNSDDIEGSVDTFTNFGREESLRTKPPPEAQTQEARSRNNASKAFSFVPYIERSRQRQPQNTNKDNNNPEYYEAVSTKNIG